MKKEQAARNGQGTEPIQIDEALLERARAGDRAALTELYEASSLELYRSLHAMLRDEELVLDVQQESYLKAFSRLDQLRDAASFLPWLRKIAVNEARAQLRRKRPLLFSELSEEGEGEPELPDQRVEAAPELALDRAETARLIREILEGLTDAQRLMLGMYYYEQIPVKEIAESLNLSQSTVKTQLRRSKKRVETEVRRLEAQGVKLYGLSPLPFLLALLKRAKPAAGAGEKALAGALPRAAETAAEAAAVHVGRSFFQTALGRVCLGLLAAAALGGGVLGYSWLRSQTTMGDVQPTEPIQILHTVEVPDSDEDLPPAETELPDFTEPETPEELPEPSTEATEPPTEPEPTEPEPTEPKSSEPVAVPTEPEPSEPENQPPAQTPTQPAAPTPTQPAAPVSPTPTEPTTADSAVLGLQWEGESGNAADWTAELPEGAGSNNRVLMIAVRGEDTPEISTDNPSLLQVWYQRDRYRRDGDVVYYGWTISPRQSGTSHVLCSLNGKTTHSLTVTVPDYPDMILSYSVTAETINIDDIAWPLEDCHVGGRYYFKALVQGQTDCFFVTNNPQVVEFGFPGYMSHAAPGLWCPRADYYIWGEIIGTGDAEVYLYFKGEIVKTWIVHASEHIPGPDESDEDLYVNP